MAGIDRNIIQSENIDLSGADIERITDGKCRIIAYEDLSGFLNIDQLLQPHNAVIILYQTKKNYGHWVSILKYDNNIEFFDPYGFGVDEELEIIEHLHIRNEKPHLTELLNSSNYNIIVNNKKLQKFAEHINTCGRWCSLRVRFKDVDLKKFTDLMTKNKCYDGDFWVSALTILI